MLKASIKEILINTRSETKLLLENINFTLNQNEIYSIVGKNGVGKSTLIKSLTLLLDKDIYSINANVFFEGRDLFSLDKSELQQIRKDKIKYVFQDAINSFDPLKTFKFYFNKLSLNKNEIEELLDYFILPKPEKLFELYPYEVSGGMAQRISFILTLLTHPKLIILDEPTSGMDAAVSNLFLLKLKEFARKNQNGVLLITQNLFFAEKVSDKISYLSDKTLTDFFTVKDFFISPENQKIKDFLNAEKELENE